jgi:hypothetical protein
MLMSPSSRSSFGVHSVWGKSMNTSDIQYTNSTWEVPIKLYTCPGYSFHVSIVAPWLPPPYPCPRSRGRVDLHVRSALHDHAQGLLLVLHQRVDRRRGNAPHTRHPAASLQACRPSRAGGRASVTAFTRSITFALGAAGRCPMTRAQARCCARRILHAPVSFL